MQPREYGPLTADKTSYGSDGADGVLGGAHATVERGADGTCPLGDSLEKIHAPSVANAGVVRGRSGQVVDGAPGCG